MKTSMLALAVLLLAPNSGTAQEACPDAVTTAALLECNGARLEAAEADLAIVVDQLRAAASEQERVLLASAQSAWELFRDAHCAWAASEFEGGSMGRVVLVVCRAELSRDRTEVLRERLPERLQDR